MFLKDIKKTSSNKSHDPNHRNPWSTYNYSLRIGELCPWQCKCLVTDGSAALNGIKEVGGITIAQKLNTAEQPGMPASAIASGYIDFVLSPENIAKEIVRIANAELMLQKDEKGEVNHADRNPFLELV